jgi:hypothetical protein
MPATHKTVQSFTLLCSQAFSLGLAESAKGASSVLQAVGPKDEPTQNDEQMVETRAATLLEFYQKHDPTKATPEFCRETLSGFKFTEVVQALQNKFGAVPEGWETSLPASTPEQMAQKLRDGNANVSDRDARSLLKFAELRFMLILAAGVGACSDGLCNR